MLSINIFKKNLKQNIIIFLLTIVGVNASCQTNNYEIFALKFATLKFKFPVNFFAIGATSKDSIQPCYIIYLLRGKNGKNILVDAGFTETPSMYNMDNFSFIRPDAMLKQLNIEPASITDIIVTHPHWDHIGGIDLYTNAMVWMQRKDFEYFVGTAWQKGGDSTGFNSKDVIKIIKKNLSNKLTLIEGDNVEILPGLTVFTGSKHTYESQYLLVGHDSDKVIIASDNSWLYYNLTSLLPIPITFDKVAYIENLKRMNSMVKNVDLILPGHDLLVFSKFKKVSEGIVKIK